MHLPYTDDYPRVLALAADSVAASLTAVLWAQPLPRRASNASFAAGIWCIALHASAPELAKLLGGVPLPATGVWLELGATLATLAFLWSREWGLAALALAGQVALFGVWSWIEGSNDEMMNLFLGWQGVLLGAHALAATPWAGGRPRTGLRSFWLQDAVIFAVAVAGGLYMVDSIFEYVVYNGDEVANSFQAHVYGHLHASAPVPPCANMFENYWVFEHHGRLFSQYTPGWPLFLAPFARLGVIWLGAPVMGGILAVGIARLARRLARSFGSDQARSERIVAVAGPLGGVLGMLGPSMLLNAGSRFSHTMVAACFAWGVEAAAEVATPGLTRRRELAYGVLLGSATALGLATRPSDGGFLGVGIFVYFVIEVLRRRIRVRAVLGTCLGFGAFVALTLVLLRLQLGVWFETAYSLAHSIHPEAGLVLAPPHPWEVKYGVPLATGSYMWWPVAPALGAVGLVRALGGRERGTAFMLTVGSLCLMAFYCFVEFGRGGDDGLGPRYVMPIVVAQAAGTGAALAPLTARFLAWLRRLEPFRLTRIKSFGPALLAFASAAYGVIEIAPHTYPVAWQEQHANTAPLRAARRMHLQNAIVLLIPNATVAGWWNLAQNPPFDPDPDVLFLSRHSPRDEACAAEHFPGRTWYKARMDDQLDPISAPR